MKELEMITGKLLGDGNITMQDGRKGRFRFSHTIKDKDWCEYCYKELKNYFPLNKPVYRKLSDKRTKKGFTEQFYVQSKTHPHVEELKKNWYPNGYKKLPFDFIEKYLSPIALAWWYYDDGCLRRDKFNSPSRLILSTDSFSYKENQFLIHVLQKRYQLEFCLDSQNRLLLYDKASILYFLKLVSTHVNFTMNRKHYLLESTILQQSSRRTSIYLPNIIEINKPTLDINNALNEKLLEICTRKEDLILMKGFLAEYKQFINLEKNSFKSYQIVVGRKSLTLLDYLKTTTGYSYSFIAYKCFTI